MMKNHDAAGPMNRSSRSLIAILLTALFAPVASAQQPRDDIEIVSVSVGYPTVGRTKNNFLGTHLVKEGCWAPVYVDIKCNRPYSTPAELVIEAPDCDHMPTKYSVPLPLIPPGQNEVVVGYARSGSRMDNLLVRIEHNGRGICQEAAIPITTIDPSQFLFLAVGSALDAVPLPGVIIDDAPVANVAVSERSLRATIGRVDQMPLQWFAYNTVDTVFLTTSDRDFITQLVGERDGRKAALVDWVRRGGKLVISVGKNQDLLAGAQELTEAMPAQPVGTSELDVPRIAWTEGTASNDPLGAVTVAQLSLKADRNPQTLLATPRAGDVPGRPLVVRAAYGFGRVTVVAFDIDDKPLARWTGKDIFWRELANRAGTRVPAATSDVPGAYGRYGGYNENSAEDTDFRGLVQKMEDFPGVPVISFGWVALFILAYIILVGPLDYFFLKKVVKRLELTWVTFPIIVLTVSAIAYYAAYALKGSDLRINKFDIVDIDLRSQLVQGRTWFTLFSPRIQNYNIGIEPSWTSRSDSPDLSDVLVGWGGQPHQSRTSLFRRSYEYLPKATGLRNVPVQVWSTKGFQGQWLAPLDVNNRLAKSDLFVPEGGKGLNGSFTINLPAALENACLLYNDGQHEPNVRMLGTIEPRTPKTVTVAEPRPFKNWLNEPAGRVKELDENANNVRGNVTVDPTAWLPSSVLFNELRVGSERPSNATLRDLDQSWRLLADNPRDAILVGTLAKTDGPAETINADAANPARLWFGAFPDAPGAKRPMLTGTLKQETCVRILLDVRLADAPRK
jgi:hypothetical protein